MIELKILFEDGSAYNYSGGKETILYWINYFSRRNRVVLKKFNRGCCQMLLSERW